MVKNHKKEEDDAQEVGEHGQLDVAYHPVQDLVWNKISFVSMLEQSPRRGDGGVSFQE